MNTGPLVLLLGAMALLALAETMAPFRPPRRSHLGVNLALGAVTLGLNVLLSLPAARALEAVGARGFGVLSERHLPAAVSIALGVVLLDASSYVAHRLMHSVSILWRFHRVHHADTFVDVTTAYRAHPLETLLRVAFAVVPAVVLGLSPRALVVYRSLSALNALLEHANVKLPWGLDALLSRVLVTPSMHKVHHSRRREEADTNYGNIFAVFDRAFDTFTSTDRAVEIDYG